jgi:hypothetical protein
MEASSENRIAGALELVEGSFNKSVSKTGVFTLTVADTGLFRSIFVSVKDAALTPAVVTFSP